MLLMVQIIKKFYCSYNICDYKSTYYTDKVKEYDSIYKIPKKSLIKVFDRESIRRME